MLALVVLSAALACALQPREGDQYSLRSTDGRYVVVDSSVLLKTAAEAGDQRFFEFVRVRDQPELVYLRYGDVLLTAEVQDQPANPAAAAQFRLYSRAKDAKVALAPLLGPGTLLRAAAGKQAVDQGGTEDDETAWWTLQPASTAAGDECPTVLRKLYPPPRHHRARRGAVHAGAATSGADARGRGLSPRGVYVGSAAMVVAATAAMLPTGSLSLPVASALPPIVANALQAGRALLPAYVRAAGGGAMHLASRAFQAMASLKDSHALTAVLLHGLLTDGVSDVVAQAYSADRDGHALALDWRRVGRSTLVTFLSDDVPFALWAKVLWDAFERLRPAIGSTSLLPGWLAAALASRLGIAALKTLASQLVYESASTAAYLGMQEAARGGGFRGVLRELRHKFWKAWTSGLAFFSLTHVAMFLLPLWWLQPLLDNLSCLGFNTYLAVLSYDDPHETSARDEGGAGGAEAEGRGPVAEDEAQSAVNAPPPKAPAPSGSPFV